MSVIQFRTTDAVRIIEGIEAAGVFTSESFGEKVGPSLMLVGDQGVYVMGNQPFVKMPDVCYAVGADPTKDEDFYQTKRDMFGGDDGVEYIPVVQARAWVDSYVRAGKEFALIELTEDAMNLLFG